MPLLGLVVLLLQVTFIVHVVRTGRPKFWLLVIILLPMAGALAYLVAEVLPDMRRSRAARQLAAEATRIIAPDREYKLLLDEVRHIPTADNKRLLAEEMIRRGQFADAVKIYDSALTPPHDTDPALLMGLARAQFLGGNASDAIASLDRLQQFNPGYQSHSGHLLYARALESAGRNGEALAEYAALASVFPGEEARCRYALLLKGQGDIAGAGEMFSAVLRAVERGGKHYRAAQKEWYDMARSHLGN